MPHHCHTWMVQSYSTGGANVHPHLKHAFLDPPESTSQPLDWFSRFCTDHGKLSPALQWAALSPSKFPIRIGRSRPPSTTWFIGPTQVHSLHPKQHLDRFSHFCRVHDCDNDRRTALLCL